MCVRVCMVVGVCDSVCANYVVGVRRAQNFCQRSSDAFEDFFEESQLVGHSHGVSHQRCAYGNLNPCQLGGEGINKIVEILKLSNSLN